MKKFAYQETSSWSRGLVGATILGSALFASAAFAADYNESPMLADLVASGALPPVEERLPTNPTVVNAVEVGEYGGTWRRAFKGPGDRWGPTKLLEERVLKWGADADGNLVLKPAFIESYEVNADSTQFTFTLLEGLKWSDGHPVTTEDVAFWYNDIFLNEALTPTIGATFAPGGEPMKLDVIDERTFSVSFAQPYVYFLQILAKDSTSGPSLDRPSFIQPAHYLKQFNNNYASEEELAAAAEANGVDSWTKLWGSKGPIAAWWFNEDLPVITAWKVKGGTTGNTVTMERNPYYYAVDQAGNQLPYIDTVVHQLFEGQEAFNLMVVQGQIDMQGRYVQTQDYTFLFENKDKGDYDLKNWKSASVWSLVPNHNTTDEVLGPLFAEADFRKALSVAIDRELINELAYSGLAEPRTASPISGSPYFDAELEVLNTEYDPDKANALLDGLGLTEKDSDGYRIASNGKRLQIVVEGNNDAYSDQLELIADNFSDVGVELLPRIIDRTQWDDNRDNNNFHMQFTPFDRLSVLPADPRRMMGSDSYANQYYVWYETKGESGIEPPADHPIRDIWAAWDEASVAASIEEADVKVNALIETFVENAFVIGIVGEAAVPNVVKTNFMNVRSGLVADDITRGIGLGATQQMWIKQ